MTRSISKPGCPGVIRPSTVSSVEPIPPSDAGSTPGTRRLRARDIARELSLAPSTVSRALNEGPVSPEVKRRVDELVERWHYRPSPLARALRGKPSNLVGVLIPDIENSFYAEVVAAVQARLEEQGLQTILAVTRDSVERQRACLEMLRDHSVDAAIVVPTGDSDGTLPSFAKERPLVLLNRLVPGVEADAVLLDNESGARAAAEHLIQIGHRRIGFIGGDRRSSTGRERLAGYRQALSSHQIAFDRSLVATGHFNRQWGVTAMSRLLEGPSPTAVITSSNRLFLGAMGVIAGHGLRVPDDLSVVSFNDPEWLANWSPPITTVATPASEVGRLTARMLLDRLSSELDAPRSLARVGTKLVVRSSTAPARAARHDRIA